MKWIGRRVPYPLGMLLAMFLIIVGLFGLVLPFIQGVLLIILGLLVFMEYHDWPWMRRKITAVRERMKKLTR